MTLSNNDTSSQLKHVERHDTYYLKGGDLHILVENTLFRVHSHFFERESKMFQNYLMAPACPGKILQGTSDSTAIVVNDASVKDFATFLWVFYNPKYSIYDASEADWTAILSTAHKLEFFEVKDLALRELSKLTIPVVQRILLYQKYEVDSKYLIPLYAQFAARAEPPSHQETCALGLSTSFIIFNARERLRSSSNGSQSPLPTGTKKEDVLKIIGSLLQSKDDPKKKEESGGDKTNKKQSKQELKAEAKMNEKDDLKNGKTSAENSTA